MKPARLISGGPISEKLQAASRALDESIERGDPTIESIERERWTAHLVRMYQFDPQASRDCLEEHNRRDKQGLLPALGFSVRQRLEELGLIEKRKAL